MFSLMHKILHALALVGCFAFNHAEDFTCLARDREKQCPSKAKRETHAQVKA